MSQEQEKIFADGFIFKKNPKAPDFVIGRVSVKVEEAIAFLKSNEKNGWVNLDIKEARSGNHYIELDTFVSNKDANPKAPAPQKAPATEESAAEVPDLPF